MNGRFVGITTLRYTMLLELLVGLGVLYVATLIKGDFHVLLTVALLVWATMPFTLGMFWVSALDSSMHDKLGILPIAVLFVFVLRPVSSSIAAGEARDLVHHILYLLAYMYIPFWLGLAVRHHLDRRNS